MTVEPAALTADLFVRHVDQAFEVDARAMAELEAFAQTMCRGSDYHQEAVQRFMDKQPTRFDWDRAPWACWRRTRCKNGCWPGSAPAVRPVCDHPPRRLPPRGRRRSSGVNHTHTNRP